MVFGWTFHLQLSCELLSVWEKMRLSDTLSRGPRCHGCFVALSCCEATFPAQGRLPVTSKDQTVNLKLMRRKEFLSFTSLSSRSNPLRPQCLRGIPLHLCDPTLSHGGVQCLWSLDNVLVQNCYLLFCFQCGVPSGFGRYNCVGAVKLQRKSLCSLISL